MADDLAAILALVVFLAIMTTYTLLSDVWRDLTATMGAPAGIPGEISALVFLVAMGAALVVYMQNER